MGRAERPSGRQRSGSKSRGRDASLAGAHFAETVVSEGFDFWGSVSLSPDGALLSAGASTGQVSLVLPYWPEWGLVTNLRQAWMWRPER